MDLESSLIALMEQKAMTARSPLLHASVSLYSRNKLLALIFLVRSHRSTFDSKKRFKNLYIPTFQSFIKSECQ